MSTLMSVMLSNKKMHLINPDKIHSIRELQPFEPGEKDDVEPKQMGLFEVTMDDGKIQVRYPGTLKGLRDYLNNPADLERSALVRIAEVMIQATRPRSPLVAPEHG